MNNRLLLLAASSASALLANGALAQEAAPPSATSTDTTGQVQEIVVTGTRIARSRLDTPAPVDVVAVDQLRQQGTPELAQALANVAPSLDFPRPAITDGTDSVRPATLRGLSPDQTLVLVNGKRRHASALVNVNGSIGRGAAAVDLNSIPTIALERVEVLREGAAAQYGSDAIAGVINLRLREARSGGAASATYGDYDTNVKTARLPGGRKAHDGNTYDVSGWQGLPLGADGFLTVSADYQYQNPTNRSDLDPRLPVPAVTARYGDPQVENRTIYANAGLPIGNGWSAYGWAGYQKRYTDSAANPRLSTNANNVLSIYPNGFLPLITTNIDDYVAVGGLKGDLAGFHIDASVDYGKNKVHYGVANSVNSSLGASSPTSFDAGIMAYDQVVANLDVTKQIDAGLAKPLGLAFGAEHRNESYSITSGDTPSYVFGGIAGKSAGAQGFPGFKPSNQVDVSRHSYSLYADLEAQVTDKFDVDFAGRFEDYSDFGSTTTGKVSARYDIVDGFAIRGTVSTGFRAPSLQQQYYTATSTNFIPINGVNTAVDVGTFPATSATAAALGGKPLEPEKSKNYSIGSVFHQGPFELTVDGYWIDINNRIVLSENIQGAPPGTGGAAPTPTQLTQIAIFNLINPPGTGSGLGAARFFINGVDTTTKGVDVVARYRWLSEAYGRFDFTAAANLNKTDINRLPTTAVLSGLPVPPILFDRGNQLAFEKGTPAQKYVFSADWSLDKFGGTVKVTHYGTVLSPGNTAANAFLDYHTGAKTLVDLEARYKLVQNLGLAVGVNNLFDQYPNQAPTYVNTNGPVAFSSYSPFGFNGRFLYARVNYSW